MRWLLLVLLLACKPVGKKDPRDEKVDRETYHYVDREGTSKVPELYKEARALLRKNDIAGARALYQQAIDREPGKPHGWVGLGSAAMQAGELELARKNYSRAAEIDPRSAAAQVGLGSVSALQGKYADSAEHYELAVAIDAANADAHWGAAMAYEQLGEREKARSHAKVFIALAPESQFVEHARRIISR